MVSLASPAGAMPPPPIPVKRPTLALKRDSSYLDTDDEAGLSLSAKKLKVAFNPNVDVRIMDDWTDKSFELVKEEVRLGVERHIAPAGTQQRDNTLYDKLLHVLRQHPFSSEATSSRLLKKYVLAIDTKVSALGKCEHLTAAMLDLSWLGREEAFVALYVKFLCDLASAHAKLVPAITERLVAHFARLPASLGRLPDETPVSRSQMFARLHVAIQTLLRQIPSASDALIRALKAEFPNDLTAIRPYMQYQRHLLRLADEIPEVKHEVLALVVQRLVSLDVQIQQDIEDFEDEEEDQLLQRPSSKQNDHAAGEDTDASDEESVSESEETTSEEEQRLQELRGKVAKMDGTLDLLFDYYSSLLNSGLPPTSDGAYQQLLSHFTSFMLPNRTRHAQFLLFHFSQTSPSRTTSFVQRLVQLSFQGSGNSRERLAACAYLSSFVARGAHVPSDCVRDVFDILCQYLENMRHRYGPACVGPDRRSYSAYYAIVQALLYIFCFRWRDLVMGSSTPELDADGFNEDDTIAEGRDLAWLPGVKDILSQNIYSRLNPLKVCSPAIVGEFAKIANHLRFLYVFPLLETNKRIRLGQTYSYYGTGGLLDIGRRETAWDRKAGEAHHQLEAYFPFDPYHLPKSKRWMANDYNEWKLPSGMVQEEEEYDESEEEDETDDDMPPQDGAQYIVSDDVSVSS